MNASISRKGEREGGKERANERSDDKCVRVKRIQTDSSVSQSVIEASQKVRSDTGASSVGFGYSSHDSQLMGDIGESELIGFELRNRRRAAAAAATITASTLV